jgi:hypothetical protein
MVTILQLPTEIVRIILSRVADRDLLTFFSSRLTCKTFQAIITDIIDKTLHEHGSALHTTLKSQFAAILDTPTIGHVDCNDYKDVLAPLRSLPWASNPEMRSRNLRREASWRQLPLVGPTGAITTKLQVISLGRDYLSNEVDWLSGDDVVFDIKDNEELIFTSEGGVRLGALYDFIMAHSDLYRRYSSILGSVMRKDFGVWRGM